MKQISLLTYSFLFLVLSISKSSAQTVLIGDQTWMAANLDVRTFRNGDSIPQAKSTNEWLMGYRDNNGVMKHRPAWCYYNNDCSNEEKCGKLYNWEAVNDPRGLAPAGWHIPSQAEWEILISNVGKDSVGFKLKGKTGWLEGGNGSNSVGFNVMPAGQRDQLAKFGFDGVFGFFWCSDYNGVSYSQKELHFGYQTTGLYPFFTSSPEFGFSVRCIKDK